MPLFCSPSRLRSGLPKKRLFCYASRSTTIALADCPHFRLEIILKTFAPSRRLPASLPAFRLTVFVVAPLPSSQELMPLSLNSPMPHTTCRLLSTVFCLLQLQSESHVAASERATPPPVSVRSPYRRALIRKLVLALVLVLLLFTT